MEAMDPPGLRPSRRKRSLFAPLPSAVRLANVNANNGAGRPLDLVASYGDFDDTTALDAPTAWRMILILRSARCLIARCIKMPIARSAARAIQANRKLSACIVRAEAHRRAEPGHPHGRADQALRRRRRPRSPGPRGRAGRGRRLPRPERRGQDHDDPLLLGLIRPTRDGPRSSASTASAARSRPTGVWPSWPGEANLWPSLTGAETLHLLGRVHGQRRRRLPGRADRPVRPRSGQEGPRLLQGEPAEGHPDRRADGPRPTCSSSTSRPAGSIR